MRDLDHKMTVTVDGVDYYIVVHSHYSGRAATHTEPEEQEEIDFGILSIHCEGDEFNMEDLLNGDVELEEAVIGAYQEYLIDEHNSYQEQKADEARDERI